MKKILAIILAFSIISCSSDKNNGERDTRLLRQSSGRSGEVILVMDSTLYNDEVGSAIKDVFTGEVEGLPREEPYFKLSQVQPQKLNNVLKEVRNLIFVMTLENTSAGNKRVKQYFSKSSLKQIEEQPDLFMYTAKDVYAQDQQVLYLFSKTGDNLAEKIRANEEQLRAILNKVERERLEEGLFKAKVAEGLSQALVEKHQFYMKIPFGYKLVENEDQFIWFRQINDESDKNIFITYRPYTSESQFKKQQIIALRDSIAREKLFEDPDLPNTHLITETGVPFKPVVTKEVNFNNHYAIEMRGLWRTKTASMGGPFISYILVDENIGRLYYIEGFLYSPGKAQREFMRELEVILRTFESRS
jgi:hypothetical protein